MGMGSSKSAVHRTRPGAKAVRVAFIPRFPSLLPVASLQHLSSVAALRRVDPTNPLLHFSTTPFPGRFSATFPAVFLCMGWRPVASPRKRRIGKNRMWIKL